MGSKAKGVKTARKTLQTKIDNQGEKITNRIQLRKILIYWKQAKGYLRQPEQKTARSVHVIDS